MALDPFAPDTLEDPYPFYDAIRRDAPVHRLPGTGIWLVSRHADLLEAAAQPEVFSSRIAAIVYAGQGEGPAVIAADPEAIGAVDVLATQDPPAHTRQRKLLAGAFGGARIAALEPEVERWTRAALDDAKGRIDWTAAVADPLPVAIIGTLLGLPPGDGAALRRWADAGVDLLSGVATPERMGEAWQEMIAFLAYLRERLAAPEPGSVTAAVASAVERGDLDEREGVSLMLQLVIAGSESTSSLIGTAARLLAERPDLQDAMRADPARLPVFLEEALRLESPFRGHFRVTTRETTLGGVSIAEGERVMLLWGAANRDPAAFDAPADLDLGRPHPRDHVAFGTGIHFCIGAPLARMEARVAIGTLLARTRSFELDGEPRYVPSMFVRRPSGVRLRSR